MGSAPSAPDPYATADAQAKANTKAARETQQLNMVDQDTPYGGLAYNQMGTYDDGTPHFKATTTLSPEQQGLLGQQNEIAGKTNTLASGQLDRLSGVLSKPVDLNNEATEARLWGLGRKRLDPMLADRQRALESKLVSEGHARGTPSWDAATKQFTEGSNDAYDQLMLTGRGHAVTEALTERNQPINEITALMGGGQVTPPTFANTPQANIAAPDIQGLITENYRQQTSRGNASMGGLFGLGGSLIGAGGRIGAGMFK